MFCPFRALLNPCFQNPFLLVRQLFQMMLKRMSILSSDEYKGVIFHFTEDKLVINSTNPDIGESKEDMDLAYKGDPVEVMYNPRFFIDTLGVVDEDNIVLNIVDDYSRVCVGQLVDLSISGERMARYLEEVIQRRGKPKRIVMDNGPEMTSKAMFMWSQLYRVRLHFIQPGKPTQNAFVESFNGKFRDYWLHIYWFASQEDAREGIENWRDHYNHVRPHGSLGKKPHAVFAREAA